MSLFEEAIAVCLLVALIASCIAIALVILFPTKHVYDDTAHGDTTGWKID